MHLLFQTAAAAATSASYQPAYAVAGFLLALGGIATAAYALGRWMKAPEALTEGLTRLSGVVEKGFAEVKVELREHRATLSEHEKANARRDEWRENIDEKVTRHEDRLHKHATSITGHGLKIEEHGRRLDKLEDAS